MTALVLLGVVLLAAYFIPTIIALLRGHAYTGVILALNIFAGWTGLGWLAAMVWAVWPAEKALIDPVIGNVTGVGVRNSGDALGAVSFGRERGYREEAGRGGGVPSYGSPPTRADNLKSLERLADLRKAGALSDAEFQAAKMNILGDRA